jgi:hypoxanthine phosphoribosyltransferase
MDELLELLKKPKMDECITERKLGHLREVYEGRYRKRNYCMTSYTMENYDNWTKDWAIINKYISYLCYQAETCPTTGKEHIQAYCELKEALDYTSIKTIFNDEKLWLGAREGSQTQAIDYTKKEDTRIKGLEWIELGIKKNQGGRTDITNVMQMLEEGKRPKDVREEFPSVYFKFEDKVHKIFLEYARERPDVKTEMKNFILIGRPGTGKTSEVYRRHNKNDIYVLNRTSQTAWFDGYTDQKVLLIDDFTKGMFSLREILQFLDEYPIEFQKKNGFIMKQWDCVYITSNYNPKDWFDEDIMNVNHEQHDAFMRRITHIEIMDTVYNKDKMKPTVASGAKEYNDLIDAWKDRDNAFEEEKRGMSKSVCTTKTFKMGYAGKKWGAQRGTEVAKVIFT